MPFLNDCNGAFSTALRDAPGGGQRITELLWGDVLHPTGNVQGSFSEVVARGADTPGFVPSSFITNDGLLEFYVIDVGQGDSVLIRTPDDRWHVIDAGRPNADQMTRKGAPNFIRWKFLEDLGRPQVDLENAIVSHSDLDHFGGFLNLLSGDLGDGRPPLGVTIRNFFHCGMGRFVADDVLGDRERGQVAPFPASDQGLARTDSFHTELLDDRNSFGNPARAFSGDFATLANLIGTGVNNAARLACAGNALTHLPGYSPADDVRGPGNTLLTIRLLGPILETFTEETSGNPMQGLRRLASDSITRNGHSIVLRFDYGNARILMTGDLNSESQRLLLSYFPASEFASDVAKGCHHGSEDVSMDFIAAIRARATVISSGDSESFSHPRPVVLGGSAFHGRAVVTPAGETLPPLIYSTELARSVKLARVDRVRVDHDQDPNTQMRSFPADRSEIRAVGDTFQPSARRPVSTNLVYGLVNVRTDGTNVMCATLEEVGKEFDIKVFQAGVDPV